MRIQGHGIAVELDSPWEAEVRTGDVSDATFQRAALTGRRIETPPVMHISSAPMPSLRGDFGSGAVDVLTREDVFIALVEYGTDSIGMPLFDTGPLPRRLDARAFQPAGLQRAIPGQSGFQHFCTENGRPFCLYVVLGAHHDARRLVGRAEDVLAAVEVDAL